VLAQDFLGDTVASNVVALGFAWQRGLVPVGRADYDFIGRTIVGSAVTVGVLTAGCLLAAGAGYLASTLIGMTWPVFVTAACLFLFLLASMTLPLLSWAFSRFDAGRLIGTQG